MYNIILLTHLVSALIEVQVYLIITLSLGSIGTDHVISETVL